MCRTLQVVEWFFFFLFFLAFLNFLQRSFILGSYSVCVHSVSITRDINTFSCYMCSERKRRKEGLDAVLYVILSSRKQTFYHCNAWTQFRLSCLDDVATAKTWKWGSLQWCLMSCFSPAALPALSRGAGVRAGVSSLHPPSPAASGACRCTSLCACVCTKYGRSLQSQF